LPSHIHTPLVFSSFRLFVFSSVPQPLLSAVEEEVVALATENAALRKENSALKRV
jgi:hypothetical protein